MKLELSERDTRILDLVLYAELQSLYGKIFELDNTEAADTPESLALKEDYMKARDLYIRLRIAAGEAPEEWIETTVY